MKIEWHYDDGYVNRTPWRTLEIPDEDLDDLSEQEQNKIIDEYVEDAFRNAVSPCWRKKA